MAMGALQAASSNTAVQRRQLQGNQLPGSHFAAHQISPSCLQLPSTKITSMFPL
jgi:hypothetical protein